MPSWNDVIDAASDLAKAVQDRFEKYGLGYLATLRADGSPRISGLEPLFAGGELWLGMMPDSRKVADLRRDPRFALHAANIDKQVADGDARVGGHALLVEDEETTAAFVRAFTDANGYGPGSGPFHLFRADVREVVMVAPAGDHLDIRVWTASKGLTTFERR